MVRRAPLIVFGSAGLAGEGLAGVVAQEGALDEGGDVFSSSVSWSRASSLRRRLVLRGPRSSGSNRSESALTLRARARALRTSRVGWLVPAS
ncbi:hypothetical protein DNL40_11245 [Xylanimonas oleitrophica]|uniref:Uncharacterized protein n=1 Tax=Xylanimonas oleitrophica TaxID=2607479 RepID=A0A2W5Y428_9MICO|nr:hypothetical protein DNL40_11245 [Xylanimonas oleitrophica]